MSLPTSTHCCAPQAFPLHTCSQATRWAAFSSGSTPAPIPAMCSGSSSSLETLLTPERWAALVRLNVCSGSDTVKPIPSYGDLETIGYGKDNPVMRQAAATTPLGPMPLAVLAHARPFELPKEAEGFSSDALESVLRAANENLATLVPNARFFVAKESGHDIHQDQPELVIEAIRQVVVGVRHPATWYDLTSCCAK